ncbi:DUF362 domain-containing protein [bacterium]|nr:DUF362 domain-containing protein [bacterium]
MNFINNIQRRDFIFSLLGTSAALVLNPYKRTLASLMGSPSVIYWAQHGTPGKNIEKVFSMMGGITTQFSNDDIIIIKPNCQWWNQGTANITALRRIIELILEIPNFSGEIIIAENHQKNTADSRGWNYLNEINNDIHAKNINELISYFHNKGYNNVTKYHWLSTDKGGNRTTGPQEGDGYIKTNILYSHASRSTPMTYPIFTSSYSGKTIDFKRGIWEHGGYTGQDFRFINLSSLNHHSLGIGVTASVKNLMGVVELPGNEYGRIENLYNFHSMGLEGMGGALGRWMESIRRPDLNIITAEWIGWGNRTDPEKAAFGQSILASADPVALDYWASKYLLYPLTPINEETQYLREFNNPDNDLPFRRYLQECHNEGGGKLNENEIVSSFYDFNTGVNTQNDDNGINLYEAAFPNPFKTYVNISFKLSTTSYVWLNIWNLCGQKVKSLINGREFSQGNHTVNWNLQFDQHLCNGTYFACIQIAEHSAVLRIQLLR